MCRSRDRRSTDPCSVLIDTPTYQVLDQAQHIRGWKRFDLFMDCYVCCNVNSASIYVRRGRTCVLYILS